MLSKNLANKRFVDRDMAMRYLGAGVGHADRSQAAEPPAYVTPPLDIGTHDLSSIPSYDTTATDCSVSGSSDSDSISINSTFSGEEESSAETESILSLGHNTSSSSLSSSHTTSSEGELDMPTHTEVLNYTL